MTHKQWFNIVLHLHPVPEEEAKRGDLCDRMSSRENEARFLHQNEVKFARQRNKMAANLDLFRMHLHRQHNANTKLDLKSPIVDRNNWIPSEEG